MPCYIPGGDYFGIKTANVFPGNRSRGLPVINSQYHLYSAETGLLLATMDGALLTKLRTGAASGLATELLADKNASILAVFGTGVQAESQIEAVCCVRPIEEVLVFGRSPSASEEFAKRISGSVGQLVRGDVTLEDLRRADVICTATNSTEALFQIGDVKPGAHINAIGAYRPEMCEISAELIGGCRLIVDELEAALEEAGDIIQPLSSGLITEDHIAGELGDLVDVKVDVPRSSDEVTVFKSVGSAVQDFVCARDLFERAGRKE